MPSIVENDVTEAAFAEQPCGRMADRERFVDIHRLVPDRAPAIVDGGAHAGMTMAAFRSMYSSSTITAFEPNPEYAALLRRKFGEDANAVIHEKALGADCRTVKFNVLNYPASSSVYAPSEINHRIHGAKMDVRRMVEVKQVRLDDVIAPGELDILKLDLQGYELEALRGAERLLPGIRVIATEVEFVSLYHGQPLFRDLDSFLETKGFRLFNFYELYTHPNGQLTAGDAIYVNRSFFGDAFESDLTVDGGGGCNYD